MNPLDVRVSVPDVPLASIGDAFRLVLHTTLGSTMLSGRPLERLPTLPEFHPTFRKELVSALRALADQLERLEPSADPLRQLVDLQDDWDGEGAPRPSDGAVRRAREVLGWVRNNNLFILEVDADVLGGVAIYLKADERSDKRVWIACMNDGKDTAVMSTRDAVVDHCMFSLTEPDRVLRFLRPERARVSDA